MATINNVIAQVDRLRPNQFADVDKAAWLSELDGKISQEVMGMPGPVRYRFPEDGNRQLLVPPPYENLYALYLFAMIDFHARDIDGYNASLVLFEQAQDEYRKFYRRTNMPKSSYYLGVV